MIPTGRNAGKAFFFLPPLPNSHLQLSFINEWMCCLLYCACFFFFPSSSSLPPTPPPPPLLEKVPSVSAVLGVIIGFLGIFSFTRVGSVNGTFDWVRYWVALESCYLY